MILCGVGYGLCFPPVALRPLAWVVLVPAFVALRRATTRRAALDAAILALSGACVTVAWLPRTVVQYFAQPFAVGVVLFVAVTAVMVVPYYVGVALFYARAARRAHSVLALQVGAAWVTGELARSHLLGGNPWVLFGYTQVGLDRVVQIADSTGVYGISFVLAAVNVAVAEAWIAWRERNRLDCAAASGLVLAALLIAITVGYGQLQLARDFPAAASMVPVVIVQGNVDVGAQWRRDFYGRNLDLYLQLTSEALRRAPAALVVWPESAMTFFVAEEPRYRETIASVLQPFGAELLAGGPYFSGTKDVKYHNAAFLIAADGAVRARYEKRRLLPFAETVPLAGVDLIRRNFGRVREFTPGAASAPLPSAAGRAGILTCNEAMYPADARARVLAGAEILVNLTNDSWTDSTQFSTIAYDMSVLRAVEQRRFLIRASTSGPSALIDPIGRTTAGSALFVPAIVRGAVAPLHEFTSYARVGDLFAYACVGVNVLTSLRWLVRRVAT
jgi:apolipoprotein N-acyltransferase